MTTDYRCKVVILFYLSCFYAKIDSQVTETPDQSLVECSGNTINLRWNYITPNMITLQWFSGSLAMMSKVQTNAPTYRNNFNESVVEFVSDAEILLKALTTASTGSYSFKVSYLTGEDYSNATYLTVYDTFSSGLSCQYNGQDITCTKPDASVSLNATDGQGQGVELINPKASGNYTICMQGDAIVCRGAFPTCTTVEVIIQGPTSQTSGTLLTTERTTSFNNTFELSYVTAPTNDISASKSIYIYNATISLYANRKTTEAKAQKETSGLVYKTVSSNHSIYVTSPTISISFFADPSLIQRETVLFASSSNYVSSYDELPLSFTFETNHFLSQTFSEATSFLPLRTNSTTVFHTLDFIYHSPIITDTSTYYFLSMEISPSHDVKSYITTLSSISSIQISPTGILDNMFEISNSPSFSSFSLITETSKTQITASVVFSGIESQLVRTTLDFDNNSFSLTTNKSSFSLERQFSQTFAPFTKQSVSNTCRSSILAKMTHLSHTTPIIITSTFIDTNMSTNDLTTVSFVSTSSENPQPKDYIFTMQTSEYYAAMQTDFSSYLTKSNTETAGLEIYSFEKSNPRKYNIHTSTRLFQTQIGLIQDSTTDVKPNSQPTDIVYSSELSEYILKDLQSTSLLSSFNIKAYTTGIDYKNQLTNMLTVETQPSRPTISLSINRDDSYMLMSAALSKFPTVLLTTKINSTNGNLPSMITPSFKKTNSDNTFVGIDTSNEDSVLISLFSFSDSFNFEDPEITSLSSGVFKSISTMSSNTIEHVLSEKTKTIIFISTSSALVTIIVVILFIIVFARTYLSNGISEPHKKDDDISWSNTSCSLKTPSPDYVFTGQNIHHMINTSPATFKMYPYENNWNEIV